MSIDKQGSGWGFYDELSDLDKELPEGTYTIYPEVNLFANDFYMDNYNTTNLGEWVIENGGYVEYDKQEDVWLSTDDGRVIEGDDEWEGIEYWSWEAMGGADEHKVSPTIVTVHSGYYDEESVLSVSVLSDDDWQANAMGDFEVWAFSDADKYEDALSLAKGKALKEARAIAERSGYTTIEFWDYYADEDKPIATYEV